MGVLKDLTLPVGLAFIFPALGGLLFGYDIGATSAAVSGEQAEKDFDIAGKDLLVGTLKSMSLIGALAASAFLYPYGDKIGRKREMLIASLL